MIRRRQYGCLDAVLMWLVIFTTLVLVVILLAYGWAAVTKNPIVF